MASEADDERWRRELAPWLELLRERFWFSVPPLPTREQMRDVWLELDLISAPDLAPPTWTRILEALELLDLLVRVDAHVGWEVLLNSGILVDNRNFLMNEAALFPRDKVLPRYQLQMNESVMTHNQPQAFLALRRMVGDDGTPWTPQSAEFLRIKQLLLDEWAQRHDGQKFDRDIEGRIQFQLQLQITILQPQHGNLIAQVKNLEIANAALEPSAVKPPEGTTEERQWLSRRQRAQFHFVEVEFIFRPHTLSLMSSASELLLMTASKSLPLKKIVLTREAMSKFDVSTHWKPIASVLGASTESGSGVQSLRIYTGAFSKATVAAVATAIAQSRSLSSLKFCSDGFSDKPDRATWWLWLGYVLFSLDTSHRLEAATLRVGHLNAQDVATFRRVIHHINPLAFICSLDKSEKKRAVLEKSPPLGALLKPGTKICVGHRCAHQAAQGQELGIVTSQEHIYPIVEDDADEDFVEIVVAGAGVAWVAREAIVSKLAMPRRSNRPLKCLRLAEIGKDAMDSVLELLMLVGGDLNELVFMYSGTSLTNGFLERVCVVCPNLKALRLDCLLASFNWLHSPQESTRCRLEKVMIESRVDDHKSFLQLFTTLSNNEHPLTRSLRELHYNSKQRLSDRDPRLNEIGEHWTDMLSKNWRLERSEFAFYDDDESEDPDPFTEAYRGHNGDQIFVPQAIAFWSVTQASRYKRQRLETDAARYRLHKESVHLIFEMAGIPLRRICV